MHAVDAVTDIAGRLAGGQDASVCEGALHWERMAPGMATVCIRIVESEIALGYAPDEDGATQNRLASALERVAARAGSRGFDQLDAVRTAHRDVLIQEAASKRIREAGGFDPLADLAPPSHARRTNDPEAMLRNAHGFDPRTMFDRSSPRDLEAIAAGRYADVEDATIAYEMSKTLRLDPISMRAGSAPHADRMGQEGGVGKGPTMAATAEAGRNMGR